MLKVNDANVLEKINYDSYQDRVTQINKMIDEGKGGETTSLAGSTILKHLTRLNLKLSKNMPNKLEITMKSW